MVASYSISVAAGVPIRHNSVPFVTTENNMKLRANGITIEYEPTGPRSAPVVTFSHSLLANLMMWGPH